MRLGLLKKSNPFIFNSGFWSGKARYRILYGGRASSKSHEFATVLAYLVAHLPLKILCTRAFQNKIKDSVKALIEEKINVLSLEKLYIIQERTIKSKVGGEFLFYGLARNTGEIKSLEGVDICYVEEGQYITKEMWDILAPTIRKEGSEIWISFNPLLETDFVFKLTQSLIGRAEAKVLKVNYTDNPFLSKTMLEEIERKRDDRDFNHIYLGEPRRELENAIIRWEDVKSSIISCSSKIERGGVIGVDIADGGEDMNAISIIQKNKCVFLEEFESARGDFEPTAKRVIRLASMYRCDSVYYDSVGVGAGFGTILRGLGAKIKIGEFIAGAKPIRRGAIVRAIGDKDKYSNIKAQMWVYLSYLLREGEFYICDREWKDKLMRELTAPQMIEKEGRKVGVEPKEKMRERGIPSPNMADSLIIALYGNIRASW